MPFTKKRPHGMKLVVLDANAYWTEQLFAACPAAREVLLLKPREVRAHWRLHGTPFGDRRPRRTDAEGVWEQRLSLPPRWLFEAWPLAKPWVRRAITRFVDGAPYALVVCFPQYRDLLDELAPDVAVYYNYDDYHDNWPAYADALVPAEDALVRRADLTICIARHRTEVLAARVPERAARIHHVPIGCTPAFLAASPEAARAAAPPAALAPHLAAAPGLAAGYVGTLGYRFDHAFLADVAARCPEVTFVLGGREPSPDADAGAPWWDAYRRLKQQPNVRFIGWVPHDALGAYLAAFDVLVMPYAACRFNRNACPAKLWDYLGTSRPIVANDVVPEVRLWDDVVTLADTPAAFAAALRRAPDEPPAVPRRRLQVARAHTYDALGRRAAALLREAAPDVALAAP